eukprot:jgi/Botrbrau1/2334/Bobra.39_1s0023.1
MIMWTTCQFAKLRTVNYLGNSRRPVGAIIRAGIQHLAPWANDEPARRNICARAKSPDRRKKGQRKRAPRKDAPTASELNQEDEPTAMEPDPKDDLTATEPGQDAEQGREDVPTASESSEEEDDTFTPLPPALLAPEPEDTPTATEPGLEDAPTASELDEEDVDELTQLPPALLEADPEDTPTATEPDQKDVPTAPQLGEKEEDELTPLPPAADPEDMPTATEPGQEDVPTSSELDEEDDDEFTPLPPATDAEDTPAATELGLEDAPDAMAACQQDDPTPLLIETPKFQAKEYLDMIGDKFEVLTGEEYKYPNGIFFLFDKDELNRSGGATGEGTTFPVKPVLVFVDEKEYFKCLTLDVDAKTELQRYAKEGVPCVVATIKYPNNWATECQINCGNLRGELLKIWRGRAGVGSYFCLIFQTP